MTVAELKEELENYDEDTEVCIEAGVGDVVVAEEVSRLDRESVLIR
jgi:hypothetical protein